MADSVAKVPKRRATKFPLNDKTAATVDRCSVKSATEVASEFVTNEVVPHINIRSVRLQPGKFVIGETKRLLQHYRHFSDVAVASTNFRFWG